MVNTDKTLAQKIIAWINKVIQKLAGNKEQKMLVKARDLWNQALKEEQGGNKKSGEKGIRFSAEYKGIQVSKSEYRIISSEFMNKISVFGAKGLPVPNYIEVNTYYSGYSCLVTDKENGDFIVVKEYELVNIHDIEEFEKGGNKDADNQTTTDGKRVSTNRFSRQSIGKRTSGIIENGRSATADGGLYEKSGSIDLRRSDRQNSRADKINKKYSIGKMQDESSASFNLQTIDIEYLDAVNRGDMGTAQRLVCEAAKAVGYDSRYIDSIKKLRYDIGAFVYLLVNRVRNSLVSSF